MCCGMSKEIRLTKYETFLQYLHLLYMLNYMKHVQLTSNSFSCDSSRLTFCVLSDNFVCNNCIISDQSYSVYTTMMSLFSY